ncbi:MAG: cupin domain-containing protein [Ignavibacteria bacterium]|nr:cupin domain-containing protein [Ignavibacteria bacterium]
MCFADSNEWIQHPEIEGVQIKRLSVNTDKGYLMILLKAAAGAEYPAHHHSGAEECYVLEGDLYVEGKYLGPGDFHHAEGDSDHDPLRTKNGCTLLLVVDPKDY